MNKSTSPYNLTDIQMETKQCGSCGGRNMTADTRDQSMVYKGETITVTSLPGWYCPDCGEGEFIRAADAQRFSDEVTEAMKLLDIHPEILPEIRAKVVTGGSCAKTIRDFRGSVTGSGDPEQERRTAKNAVSRRIIGEI